MSNALVLFLLQVSFSLFMYIFYLFIYFCLFIFSFFSNLSTESPSEPTPTDFVVDTSKLPLINVDGEQVQKLTFIMYFTIFVQCFTLFNSKNTKN